jgi:ABC-2 type transport system permease protein
MKLWDNYKKELKIASRGFYFYMEVVTAAILLVAILLFVPAETASVSQEVIFVDGPRNVLDSMLAQNLGEPGHYERAADTPVRLRPMDVTYYDEQTGERFDRSFTDKKTLELETWNYYNAETGALEKTLYVATGMDDMLRVARTEKWYATVVSVGQDGQPQYRLLLFGSESARYQNLISAVIGAGDTPALLHAMDAQTVETLGTENVLDNRQSFMPMAVVIMNGLMGMLVVISYLIIDKSSGLIRAMALTPMRTRSYLMSKVLVVLTTSLASSVVVAVPIMGAQANYLLFIPIAALVSVTSCMFGLWLASFFSDIKSAYGIIFLMLLLLVIPAMSYILPSFAPLWIKLMPTYPMLQAVKETLLKTPDVGYVLLTGGGMIAVSGLLLWLSERRYRRILGV